MALKPLPEDPRGIIGVEGLGRWLVAVPDPSWKSAKTQKWLIGGRDHVVLGHIGWYARWRQYAFFPREDTVFDRECLRDIRRFLSAKMEERKRGR